MVGFQALVENIMRDMWRKQGLLGRFPITPDKWSSYPHIDITINPRNSFCFIFHMVFIYSTSFELCSGNTGPVLYMNVGPHPAGLHALYLPILESREQPLLDNNGLADGGVVLARKKVLEWHATVWQKAVRAGPPSPLLGGGGVTSIRLAQQLPGKQADGHAPHLPSDKLSRWRCSDLKVRVIISRGRG